MIGGLDPGLNGALAVVEAEPRWKIVDVATWDARKSTGNRKRALGVIAEQLARLSSVPPVIVTEHVGSMPQQGLASTHGFGLAQGIAEGILTERGARFIRVAPAKWKRHLGLSADKCQSLALARVWAPGLRLRAKDHNVAEAVLLAVWYAMQEAHRTIRPSEAGKWGLLQ